MPDVILPVLDEAGAIAKVLGAMPAGYRAIVVDNGSRDGSGALAASLGALVVHEPKRGFGAACHAGLLAATQEVVCIMDCDGSFDPRELPRLVAPVESGEAELVLGWRRPSPGSWPLHARLANWVLMRLLRARAGVEQYSAAIQIASLTRSGGSRAGSSSRAVASRSAEISELGAVSATTARIARPANGTRNSEPTPASSNSLSTWKPSLPRSAAAGFLPFV